MKTLRFIGMAIVAVIMSVNFTACSDDDEDDKQSNTIIGTWEVTGDSDSDEEYNAIGEIYTFYSNGTVLNEWENDFYTYNYKLNSDNTILSIDYEDGDGYEEMYLEITDNKLMKWTYVNYEGEYLILKRIK
ncbi:hypothetical protein [Bacteroides intestinalis]|jgi:uncharacterized lipoprotein YehR (DUF1307 family)|uniref:hypothetical protein n=1 Tax=Bacteroides intestinalis TaxID=329854 RepID=UPI0022E3850A|nr:hypothetical protein [Bacteroides intestinalis]